MEPVGLAVGVAGLAGLFSAVLETIDKVRDYRTFADDSQTLAIQFEADSARFEEWGRRIGLNQGQIPTGLATRIEQRTLDAVKTLVRYIYDILKADSSSRKQGRIEVGSLGDAHVTPDSKKAKLKWVFGGKIDRAEQVRLFGVVVQKLHDLVPPDQWEKRQFSAVPSNVQGNESDVDGIAEVRRMIKTFDLERRAEKRRDVCHWLLGNQYFNERYQDSIQKRLQGSCGWVFGRPELLQWLTLDALNTAPNILWINGHAGFGKTILCARVVEWLSDNLNTPLAHFFFSSETGNYGDPYMAIRSWLAQLASSYEDIFALVYQTWSNRQHHSEAPRSAIMHLLKETLRQSPGCTLVVDGLDECMSRGNESRSIGGGYITVTKFLQDLIQATATTSTRIMLVSRDELDIRQGLESDTYLKLAEIRITAKDNLADIEALSREIIKRKLPNKSDNVRNALSSSMTQRCDGQFLWLMMQEPSLRKGMSQRQLQKTIEDTPVGLEHIYDRNWSRISNLKEDDRYRAFALLRWAAFSLRPLTVSEITEAVLIDENYESFPIDKLPDATDDDYVDTEILGLCSPLLEVREQPEYPSADERTIQLAHFSVKQYLLCSLPVNGLSVNESLRQSHERKNHTILARLCLTYMKYRQAFQDPQPDQGAFFERSLRDYVFEFWPRHVISGVDPKEDPDTSDLVFKFMSGTHPSWGEWTEWFDEEEGLDKMWREGMATETQSLKPLYYALRLHLTEAAIRLLRVTKGLSFEGIEARAALDLACLSGNTAVVQAMLNSGADIQRHTFGERTPLCSAAQTGQVELVRLLVENGADINAKDGSGERPIFSHHLEVVKLLVDYRADISSPGFRGWTPISLASFLGYLSIVRLLIDSGADINTAFLFGKTPVHWAAGSDNIEIVKLLIDSGADITVAADEGCAPIHTAAESDCSETIRLLLDRGADIAISNNDGCTPLHKAAILGHVDTVRLLLDRGAEITVSDNNGDTPLHDAACFDCLEVAGLLLEHGANISVPNNHGCTPLHDAAQSGHLKMIRLLLNASKVSMNSPDYLGRTALFFASRYGHDHVVETLVSEYGALHSLVDYFGTSPLSTAVRNGYPKVVSSLFKTKNMFPEVWEPSPRPLIWWAERRGDERIVELLQQHAEEFGASLPPYDPPPTSDLVAKQDALFWCEACTLDIVHNSPMYKCQDCIAGDFYLCSECFLSGVRCQYDSHSLRLL